MSIRRDILCCAALIGFSIPAHAAQTEETSTQQLVPPTTRIASDVPTYIENGVVMAPIKSLSRFLDVGVRNVFGIITVERASRAGGGKLSLYLRDGATKAQIEDGASTRTLTLPSAVQTRLGNTFVPARAFVSIFGATSQSVPEEKGILVRYEGRSGRIGNVVKSGYRGSDAARVTIANNVGRALSLYLRGPQNIRVELGPRERITQSLRPGEYTFQAASNGMKLRNGKRRFHHAQRANWSWGRHK